MIKRAVEGGRKNLELGKSLSPCPKYDGFAGPKFGPFLGPAKSIIPKIIGLITSKKGPDDVAFVLWVGGYDRLGVFGQAL